MQRFCVAAMAVVSVAGVLAQEPVKKIEDGVLDRIELFAPSLENPKTLTVVIKPFDATTADLGTGGKEGKKARQEEAQAMLLHGGVKGMLAHWLKTHPELGTPLQS